MKIILFLLLGLSVCSLEAQVKKTTKSPNICGKPATFPFFVSNKPNRSTGDGTCHPVNNKFLLWIRCLSGPKYRCTLISTTTMITTTTPPPTTTTPPPGTTTPLPGTTTPPPGTTTLPPGTTTTPPGTTTPPPGTTTPLPGTTTSLPGTTTPSPTTTATPAATNDLPPTTTTHSPSTTTPPPGTTTPLPTTTTPLPATTTPLPATTTPLPATTTPLPATTTPPPTTAAPLQTTTTPPPTSTTNGTNAPSFLGANFANDFLKAHNDYRAKHGTGALVYDPEINIISQAWADNMAKTDIFAHSHKAGYGENIYYFWSSDPTAQVMGKDAVDAWYAEIKDYDFNTGTNKTAGVIGHFTQVVWSNSTKLGVGAAKNSTTGSIYVVGNYYIQGNVQGQYLDNVHKLIA